MKVDVEEYRALIERRISALEDALRTFNEMVPLLVVEESAVSKKPRAVSKKKKLVKSASSNKEVKRCSGCERKLFGGS